MLSYKILLRKSGIASSILATAFLIAILASMNSVANYISLQTQMLGGLINPGGTCLIARANAVHKAVREKSTTKS